MIKYAKVINAKTKLCDVGVGTNIEYYKKIGMKEQDVEQAYNGQWYIAGCAPQEPQSDIIKKQITELESQQTSRLLRNASLGEEYAVNKLKEIEDKISTLREQLSQLSSAK